MPQTESEEQLRHLADRLATTLEDISYAFYMLDRDWRFTYLNNQAEKLLWRDRAELLGKVIWEEFKDAVNGPFYSAYNEAVDQNTKVEVELFSNVLGLWLEVHLYPSEEGLTVYLRDITLRKKEQEKLRLLETCVSRLNDIVIITEADSLDEPGPRIVFVNDAFERRTGYLREEVLGRSPRFLQGPQTQRGELDRIRTALMNFEPVRVELINYTKSGEPYWLEIDTVPITDQNGLYTHFVAVQRDITVRMKAQQQLEIHSHLLNVIGQAVIVTDVMGTVTYWNRFAETLYGWSSAEVQGRNILEVTPTDTMLQQAEEIMNSLMRGESWSGEFIVQKRDGTMFPAYVTNTPVLDEAGQIIAIIGLSLDITERKQAEEALARSEREQRELAQQLEIERSRLVAAQQVAKIGSWETDLTTLEVIWSEETHRIHETDPATFHPTHPAFLALVHPEDRAGVDATFIRSFDQRTVCEIEHRLLLTEGRIKFVEERWEIVFDDQGGEPVRAIGTCQDITERKQSEKRIREQAALLDKASDAIIVRGIDHRIQFWNKGAERLYGWTPEEVMEGSAEELLYSDPTAFREATRLLLEQGEWGGEITQRRKDGRSVIVEGHWTLVRDENGQPQSILAINTDITKRKRQEERLKAREEHFRLALEGGNLASWHIDSAAGKLLQVSDQMRDFFGVSADFDFTWEYFLRAILREDRGKVAATIAGAIRSRENSSVEYRVVRPDGTIRWLGSHGRAVLDKEGKATQLIGVTRDITERKLAEAESAIALQHAQDRADRDPLTDVLNHRAFHKRLEEEIARSRREQSTLAVVMLDLDNFKFFNDVYGHVVGDEVLRLVASHLQESCRSYDTVARFGGDEFALLMPSNTSSSALEIEQRLTSVLGSLSFTPEGYESVIPLSISVGVALYPLHGQTKNDLISLADERLRRAKTGGERTTEADQTREQIGKTLEGFSMLDALVTAVDNKDRYTKRHSEDVMTYCLQIARELGMEEPERKNLAVAALLHDVGKIGIPDAILRKPGKLTDAEYEAIKQHPSMGAAIVGAVAGLESTLDAVRHHHERWDGKGYPFGLAGEDIPYIARLMAVADAYSAMTTDRPYRQGMSAEKAKGVLASGAGEQWDAQMVEAFIKAPNKHG